MKLEGAQVIAADRMTVWNAINDPEILKRCIPGCEEMQKTSPDQFEAVVKQKVGPVSATFKGIVNLSDVDEGNSLRLSGEGKGGVAGMAKGGALVTLTDVEGGTQLSYDADASVAGKLAQLGSRLIDGVAQKMVGAFFTNFKDAVEADSGMQGASSSSTASASSGAGMGGAAAIAAAGAAGAAVSSQAGGMVQGGMDAGRAALGDAAGAGMDRAAEAAQGVRDGIDARAGALHDAAAERMLNPAIGAGAGDIDMDDPDIGDIDVSSVQGGPSEGAAGSVSDTVDRVGEAVTASSADIQSQAGAMASDAANASRAGMDAGAAAAAGVAGSLGAAATGAAAAASSSFDSARDSVSAGISGHVDAAGDAARGAVDRAGDAVAAAGADVQSQASGMASDATAAASSSFDSARDSVSAGVSGHMDAAGDAARGAVGDVAASASATASGAMSSAEAMATDGVNTVRDSAESAVSIERNGDMRVVASTSGAAPNATMPETPDPEFNAGSRYTADTPPASDQTEGGGLSGYAGAAAAAAGAGLAGVAAKASGKFDEVHDAARERVIAAGGDVDEAKSWNDTKDHLGRAGSEARDTAQDVYDAARARIDGDKERASAEWNEAKTNASEAYGEVKGAADDAWTTGKGYAAEEAKAPSVGPLGQPWYLWIIGIIVLLLILWIL